MTSFGDKLDIVISKAPALRDAGVLRVEVDGCLVELSAKEQPMSEELKKILNETPKEGQHEANPLNDASTFGLPNGSDVPGFSRLIDKRERDE